AGHGEGTAAPRVHGPSLPMPAARRTPAGATLEAPMSIDFQPGPGQVALVEYAERSDECLTGLVLGEDGGYMAIDLGASGPLRAERDEVVVSVFAPDAMYRLRATARSGQPDGVIVLTPVHAVERI